MKSFFEDLGTKKLLIIAGVFVGIIVLIVLALLLYNKVFSNTSYYDIENTMVKAAKEYYSTNTNLLPVTSGGSVSVTANSLTAAGHMKELGEYTAKVDESVSCSGSITVTNINGNYRYTPNLNCGERYATKTLVSQIRSQENLVTSGQGLYEMNGAYVFRGDAPNNFVKFANHLWYITKIENDHVYLMLADRTDIRNVWDDRFNVERNFDSGINDYSVSRIRTYLENLYAGDNFISSNDKMLLSPYSLAIGKRHSDSVANDGSIEGSELLENTYLGVLPAYDYINASIDTSCVSTSSESCANYNYLSYLEFSWWLATGNADNTHQAYKINTGKITSGMANQDTRVQPYIRLVKDALYVQGDGTSENPYIIK